MKKWFKKYFIPHKENNHKPHLLRGTGTLFFLTLIIIVELGFLVNTLIIDKSSFLAAVLPGVLTNLTNEERAQNNANPLIENTLLNKAAQMKASDMAEKGYFAHTSPDGKTPWYWLDKVGYLYKLAGENLAVNFFESKDVAEAWMNSPTHRANVLKKEYKEIGFGIASGTFEGKNTVFVAEFFGTPMFENTKIEKIKEVASKENTKNIAVAKTESNTKVLGESVTTTPAENQKIKETNTLTFKEKIALSPRKYTNYVYLAILFIVALCLFLVFFIKAEVRHTGVMLRGFGLMIIIIALLLVNLKISKPGIEISSGDSTTFLESVAY
jgi:hypothetical protein